jgi:hypothetical protein
MPFLNDLVLDNGLAVAAGAGRRLDLCAQLPASYAEATLTHSLGHKTGLTVTAPEPRSPSGRKVVVPQVLSAAPGDVTGTGTVTHWALSDPANSRLIAAAPLEEGQAVTNGNTWTLTSPIDIGLIGIDD